MKIALIIFFLSFNLLVALSQNTSSYTVRLYKTIDSLVTLRSWDSVVKYEGIYKKLIESTPLLKDTTYAKALERSSIAHYYKGHLILAEENSIEAVKLYEIANLLKRANYCYIKIGAINLEYKKYDKAKYYFTKTYNYFTSVKDTTGTASSCLNLFDIYLYKKKYDSAYHVASQVANLPNSFGSKRVKAHQLLADLFTLQHQYDSAIHYLNKAKDYHLKLRNNATNLTELYARFFKVYQETNQKQLAKEYAYKTYNTSQTLNSLRSKIDGYECMYKYFELVGKSDSAFIYIKKYYAYHDSIYNDENAKKATDQEIRYTYEKKQLEVKNENEKKEIERAESDRRTKLISIGFIIAFILSSIIVLSVFVAYRRKKHLNDLLIIQKQTIEQKNTLIIDSITYAKKIQNSMLPNENSLGAFFKNHLIIYHAKDIVSGDFYWFKENDDSMLFAIADCTGHGVPGAFMSVLCISILDQILNSTKHKNLSPQQVTSMLNVALAERLGKNDNQTINDGVELIVAKFNKTSKTLEFSGSKSFFFHIRQQNINIHKADRVFIGKDSSQSYNNYVVSLEEGDLLYFFSDGLHTQKGGPENKKMNLERFKELLLSISKEPFDIQKTRVENAIKTWIGENEQFDDILILGLQV